MYRIKRNIQRIFIAFFSVLWVFTASCAPLSAENELFFYRTETVEAEISLEYSGAFSRFRYSGNGSEAHVEFTAPEELTGFSISVTEDGGEISIDGLTAEAPDALCTIPKVIQTIFTLSPEDVSEITTAPHPEKEGETVTRVTAKGITVTLNDEGLPILAEGTVFGVKFTAKIAELAVNPRENGEISD